MSKVTFEAVNSANVRMNNSVDTEKVYDIVANVNVNGKELQNVDSGTVKKDDVQMATFNKWGENSLAITFQTSSLEEQIAIIGAVNTFINDCKVAIEEGEIVIQ